jgi:protein-disulfide isomerase
MSKREELRKKRQEAARRQQFIVIGVVALAAIVVAGILIWPNLQPVGAIVTAEPEIFPRVDGSALGPQDARAIIQVFSDFKCPFCQRFADGAERQVIDSYIATGQSVRLDYLHFIVIDGNVGGNESRRAAEASECAAEQGKFWEYHAIVYANQTGEAVGTYPDRKLKAFAETIGLDTAAFNTCFDTGRYARSVTQDETVARQLGVNSTPTVFVNGTRVNNPLDFNEISALIDAALGQ